MSCWRRAGIEREERVVSGSRGKSGERIKRREVRV
jgi:hypothetical protein